jgi:uncharacterized protein YdeI (YjbR/CyaY-like superfamily)
MEPKFFKTQQDFRKWLEANHDKKDEIIVGFYKVGSGKPSMTWSQAVDQALCFGWIDGVRRKHGEDSYTNRFTPRRPRSIWSTVNIAKVAELAKNGLMRPAGIAAFEKRDATRSAVYAYENSTEFSAEFEQAFKQNIRAWEFFSSQAPWYRRTSVHRVMSAKQEKTRTDRLERLIEASRKGERW